MPQTEFDSIIYEQFTEHFVVNATDFDAVTHIAVVPIQAQHYLENVRVRVKVAFDAGTTLLVGETGTPNLYVVAAALNPTVVGAVKNSNIGAAVGAEGKQYDNGGLLTLTLNQAVTVGQLFVDLQFDGYEPVHRGMVDHQTPTYQKHQMTSIPWAGSPADTTPPAIP